MTPKQILDSFSETLMLDERIFSAQERALVATLLQHAKAASNQNPETQEAVRAVIASAVGETVAQRAFAVLGGSIVERILEGSKLSQDDSTVRATTLDPMPRPPFDPQPPGELLHTTAGSQMKKEPEPPSVQPGPGVRAPQKAPQPPGRPMGEPEPPSTQPHPPGPGVRAPRTEPEPPSNARTTTVLETSAAVAERPSILPARCVILDEFLAPQECEDLTRFTLEHESDFRMSSVVSPHAEGGDVSGVVNYDHRRSRVLMDLAQHEDVMLDRIKAVLPMVLDKLGMEEFDLTGVEAQVTASNEGDFFHFHSDNGSERVRSRHLTFVYFFHHEPRQFEGGELRIHDSHLKDRTYVSDETYQAIVPQQNQIVFFPCELLHEITPVRCASQHFSDSRFTLNGWLRH